MTSENASLSKRMFDASVRVEEMYWIGGNFIDCLHLCARMTP